MHEYAFLDSVSKLQRKNGWCQASREYMAQWLGLTKRSIIRIIDRLIQRKYLIRNKMGWLRVPEYWEAMTEFYGDKKSPDRGQKVTEIGDKRSPNNNTINTDNGDAHFIRERETQEYLLDLEMTRNDKKAHPERYGIPK